MKVLIFFLTVVLGIGHAHAQQKVLDIPAMHQLISQSETEYERQNAARDKQSLVTANEKANLTLLEKVKKRYRELQQRYNTLGTAINVADIGINATPMVNRIIDNQSRIMEQIRKQPALVAMGMNTELVFAAKAKSLASFIAGLVIAVGDVNQMKASDRKILFDFVLSELSYLQELSGNLAGLMEYGSLSSLLRSANPFQNFIDADKQIAGEILRNAKYLK